MESERQINELMPYFSTSGSVVGFFYRTPNKRVQITVFAKEVGDVVTIRIPRGREIMSERSNLVANLAPKGTTHFVPGICTKDSLSGEHIEEIQFLRESEESRNHRYSYLTKHGID